MNDETALATAAELINAGRQSQALVHIARVLAHAPDNPDARLLEAMALEADDPGAARDRSRSLAGDFPDWPEAWEQLTFVLAEHFTPAETLRAARRALALRPDNERVQLCLSDSYLSHADPGAALAAVDRALAINPQNWRAQARRGHCLLLTGHRDEGLAIARAVAGEHPDDPYAVQVLATMESAAGHHGAAIRVARQAAEQAMGQHGTADTALTVQTASVNRMLVLWCTVGPVLAGTWPLIWAWPPSRKPAVAAAATLAAVGVQVLAWPALCHGLPRRRMLAVLRSSTPRMRVAVCTAILYLLPIIIALGSRYEWARHGIVPVLGIMALIVAGFMSVGVTIHPQKNK